MKKQNGITLIALVITIIVLLILAGVSISLIVGDNGILNQASTSVVKTREAEAKDEVSMAWAGMETDYLAEWTNNTGLVKDTSYINGKLSKYLEGTGEIVEGTFKYENDTYTFTYKPDDDDLSYEMTISVNGKVNIVGDPSISEEPGESDSPEEGATVLSEITAANYGDYVNYNKDLGLTLKLEGESTPPKTDWRIFYKDTEQDRVYLIASHYVPNTCSLLKASSARMSKNGDYSLYWDKNNLPNDLSNIARKDSIFGITESSYKLDAKYASSKCVSLLLDTDHWDNFVDYSVADFAIGGPTIDMFANSWNENMDYKMKISYSSTTGYGENTLPFDNDTDIKNLYIPSVTTKNVGSEECTGYWLSAPSGCDELDRYMLAVYGGMDGTFCDILITNLTDNVAVRPIVALQAGMSGTKDANGVWQLGE